MPNYQALLLRVTEVEFDFDEEVSEEEEQEVVNSVVGQLFEVVVEDENDNENVANCLVEEVTEYTNWLVYQLNYELVQSAPLQ